MRPLLPLTGARGGGVEVEVGGAIQAGCAHRGGQPSEASRRAGRAACCRRRRPAAGRVAETVLARRAAEAVQRRASRFGARWTMAARGAGASVVIVGAWRTRGANSGASGRVVPGCAGGAASVGE